MRARSSAESGFTLIEMIVTIGIIIMAAGFLAPSLATMFANRKLENAGTLISGVMNEARTKAVTEKRTYVVVFLRDGLRLYHEAKGESPAGFTGNLEPYDPDNTGTLKYHLHFAGLSYDQIPTDLYSIIERDITVSDEWEVTDDDIALRFRPDGTIDFGKHDDVPQFQFNKSPPELSDIEIERLGDVRQHGYIDMSPTGRTSFKLDTFEGAEE